MKSKLDHNLSRHLRSALEAFGHDVDTAFDEGLARSPDKEILYEAPAQDRILFTLDTDFLNLKAILLKVTRESSYFARRDKEH
jgi:predicted nuclease of predicted toxin-antitoxin system